MRFKSLTNVRPIKDQGCELIASPTPGGFKLSDAAASVLGVASGDRIDIVEHPAEPGTFFVGKGFEDENGTINGSKLGRSGSYLTCSAAAAWQKMGDSENNTHYTIDAENGETDDDSGATYYPLLKDKVVAKQQRAETSGDAVESAPVAEEAVELGSDLEDL